MRRRFLDAEWRHLAMVNYPVDPDLLRPLLPRGTEFDFWNGRTFVSIVGFLFLRTRVLGIPVPCHRNFEEVNLRFYVRRRAAEGWRRGVVFVKELVPRRAIAAIARWFYNENYEARRMASDIRLPGPGDPRGSVEYRWQKRSRWDSLRVDFEGVPQLPAPDSEEAFIAEHYWGYVVQRDGSAVEYGVEHPPWRVWRATLAELDCDVRACYGEGYHETLSRQPTSAFVAEGSPVSVFRGERLSENRDLSDALAAPESIRRPL